MKTGSVAPSQGRELKPLDKDMAIFHNPVAPSQGRELKLTHASLAILVDLVAPSQGRELKHCYFTLIDRCLGSPLHRGVN